MVLSDCILNTPAPVIPKPVPAHKILPVLLCSILCNTVYLKFDINKVADVKIDIQTWMRCVKATCIKVI